MSIPFRLKKNRNPSHRLRGNTAMEITAAPAVKCAGAGPSKSSAVRMKGWNVLISIRAPMVTVWGAASMAMVAMTTRGSDRTSGSRAKVRMARESPRRLTPSRKARRGRGSRFTDMGVPLSPDSEAWSGTASVRRLRANAVLLELAVQAGSVDSQDRRRQLLVPVTFRERLQNVEALVFIERQLHVGAIFHGLPDARGKVHQRDPFPFGQNHGAFDGVFQLPDISRPGVVHQRLERLIGVALERLARLARAILQK